MITNKKGDLFNDDAQAIVNTVNCVGVMGRGIALQFKKRYPNNYKAYKKACEQQQVVLGKMFVYQRESLLAPQFIINFPTKAHWRNQSHLHDIEAGLEDLVRVIKQHNIHSIAIPPLGSGLGGLPWQDVKKSIEVAMASLPNVDVRLYEPLPQKAHKPASVASKAPNMTPGRAALVALMQRYLHGLLDPTISLLEVHKLMFFMQEAGEPLQLSYVKKHYGPYATNLRHVLNYIEGHFIEGYSDGGDKPTKLLYVMPSAVKAAKAYITQKPATQQHLQRVNELVAGFETPYGLELLATVYWVASREQANTLEQVQQAVYEWNQHKQQFTPKQIQLAYRHLVDKGWL